MELTIAKILFTKEVTGARGIQHNTRFTTNEMGEKSISGFFDQVLRPGDKITGEVVDKPGVDRNGNQVVYHNFTTARKAPSTTGSFEPLMVAIQKTYAEAYASRQEIVMVRQLLQQQGVLPKPEPVENTKTAFDEPAVEEQETDFDIAPSDIPW